MLINPFCFHTVKCQSFDLMLNWSNINYLLFSSKYFSKVPRNKCKAFGTKFPVLSVPIIDQ